jgi:glycosyltransferase involved in cell wall biosynthesis
MKVAIIDDYLKMGGAALVVAALHEIFPEAPIYTIFSQVDKDPLLTEKFKGARIIESWFARLPWSDKLISPLRFLIPLIWGSFDFSQYDLVISSASWAITKGFARGKTKEICYCHTPPRYLYGYETSRNWQKRWYIRLYASVVGHFMRLYDYQRARKVTWFVANSKEVQARIKKFYQRESVVINPPVEISKVSPFDFAQGKRGNYYLTGGRLEMPKNFDLVIKAINKLKLPLKVYGSGFQEEYLRSMAGPTVEFVGAVGNKEKSRLMAEAKAFIVAATDEDFGITPVEAMAMGTPVIAFHGGGYLETVVEGKTGEFFDEPTVESLVKTLKSFNPKKYNPEDCRRQARKFSKERFIKEVKKFVEEHAGTS